MIPLHQHALNLTRRRFLGTAALTLGAPALQSLMAAEKGLPSLPHFAPKAKRVIYLFQNGAPSHVDLFDYKPELIRQHGKPADFGEPVEAFQNGLGPWLRPVWDFKPHGKCGKQLSEVVAPLGSVVDEIPGGVCKPLR